MCNQCKCKKPKLKNWEKLLLATIVFVIFFVTSLRLAFGDECVETRTQFNYKEGKAYEVSETYYYETFSTLEEAIVYATEEDLVDNILYDSEEMVYQVWESIPLNGCVKLSEN